MSADVRRGTRTTSPGAREPEHGPAGGALRIGLVAAPFVPVPPTTYGGTEGFLDTLARGLTDEGHEVELFTVGSSTCPVERRWVFETPPEPMGLAVHEAVQVRAAYNELGRCDVIHDNTATGPVWAAATRHPVPVVLTTHVELTPEHGPLWVDLARWATLVAISCHQRASAPQVPFATVIHHGIDTDRVPVGSGSGGYLVFLGRLSAGKGARAALQIARRAGMPIHIAAKMREPAERDYFERLIRPHVGPDVVFLGEVSPAEREQELGGALALLNPITWAEPFGLVMIEAMACGTPVISYPNGAAPEIVEDGITGFLCNGEDEAVEAVGRAATLSRPACRAHVQARFSARRMVRRYVQLYRDVVAKAPHRTPPIPGTTVIPGSSAVRRPGAPAVPHE